ncbi:DUF1877 family protein [Sphingobacterium multivorum]|nr:DUF1877 family protein [Sphingobacterium multivorum]QQT31984.1 DUF1877 family protein [Sphingobacterium multivorum]
MGPTEIDPDQDMGYCPAKCIMREQTKEIYSGIKDLTKDELSANSDPSTMTEEGIFSDIGKKSHFNSNDQYLQLESRAEI